MKKNSKQLLLIALLALALVFAMAVTVSAAEEQKGISGVTSVTGVIFQPQTESGENAAADSDGFYANAECVKVTYTGCKPGSNYAVFAIKGGSNAELVPTQENIAYIDQFEAKGNTLEFTVFPNAIEKDVTYNVFISSNDINSDVFTYIGSFKGAVKGGETPAFKRGDVDGDGDILPNDAALVLRYLVKDYTLSGSSLLAADVDKDGAVQTNDAALILRYCVKDYEIIQ